MDKMKFLFIVLMTMMVSVSLASVQDRALSGGVQFGFGLPKAPYRFRMPISVTGGVMLNYQLNDKIQFQSTANTLTSFDLGTIDGKDGDLKFDLNWVNLSGLYKVRGKFSVGSYLLLGAGYYQLNQKFDNSHDKLNTYGFVLGISNNQLSRKVKTVFDLKWHLLFEPSPQPQLLTVTFGILL